MTFSQLPLQNNKLATNFMGKIMKKVLKLCFFVIACFTISSCGEPEKDEPVSDPVQDSSISSDYEEESTIPDSTDSTPSNKTSMWVPKSIYIEDKFDSWTQFYTYDAHGRILHSTDLFGEYNYTYASDAIYIESVAGSFETISIYNIEGGVITHDESSESLSYSDGKVVKIDGIGQNRGSVSLYWSGSKLLSADLRLTNRCTVNVKYVDGNDLNEDGQRFINAIAYGHLMFGYDMVFSGCLGKVPMGGVISQLQYSDDSESFRISYADIDSNGCPQTLIIKYSEDGNPETWMINWQLISIK